MDEKPKSIWKKLLKLPGLLLAWLVLLAVTMLVFLIIILTSTMFPKISDLLGLLIFGAVVATILLCFWLLIRLLFCWRNLKRTLFGLACFATLIALFYAEEDWRGKHDWEKFRQEQEAKGEKFDWQSTIPAPVPDDQNFALTPVIASSYEMYFDKSGHEVRPRNTNVVDRLSMITWRDNHWAHQPKSGEMSADWPASKRTDLKAWQEYFRSPPPTNSRETNSFPVTPQPQSPADDVLLALSKYDSAIEEIRQAGQLPDSRFPLTYGSGEPANILLPHLNALRSCAQALGLRAQAELQNGRGEKALADVKLQLRLVDAIRTEPFLISQLVRVAMLQTALQPVWEGLAERKWSDEQLAGLDAALAKFDFLADCATAMRGERGLEVSMIEYLGRTHDASDYPGAQSEHGAWLARLPFSLIPTGWYYQNELRIGRFYDQWYLPVVNAHDRTISPANSRAAQKALDAELRQRWNPESFLERWLLPALGKGSDKMAYAQASTDLARTAIALERDRLAHGEFPEVLDALAPQFIAQVPHDVIGGGPLKYRRTADGQFVLYSIGWNERDDGGVVVFNKGSTPDVDREEGDWVWRYPKAE
jgi:hypothetical protein